MWLTKDRSNQSLTNYLVNTVNEDISLIFFGSNEKLKNSVKYSVFWGIYSKYDVTQHLKVEGHMIKVKVKVTFDINVLKFEYFSKMFF